MKLTAIGLMLALTTTASADEPVPTTTLPKGLGLYSELSNWCGKAPIAVNPRAIPPFGCFYLTPGHSAAAIFEERRVAVTVDANGKAVFTGEGATQHGVEGYVVNCLDDGFCETRIDVFWLNEDRSVLFNVAECVPPRYHSCANSKEGLDYLLQNSN